MTLKLVTGPTTLPITVAQAKANGRIDSSEEDALIESYIRAALFHAERWCGMAFEPQSWEVVLDEFPASEIKIPFGPLVEVTSVKYIEPEDGIELTVAAENYEVDTDSPDGWVIPVSGYTWPATMDTINAVRVRFVAGKGTPEDAAIGILLLTEHLYENRAASGDELETILRQHLHLHRQIFI